MHAERYFAALAVATTLAVTACATTSNLSTSLSDAQAALTAAEEVKADEIPNAAYHLQLAQEGLDLGKRKLQGDRFEREEAELVLEGARLDAELALAYARTSRAQREADEAWGEVRDLRKEAPAPKKERPAASAEPMPSREVGGTSAPAGTGNTVGTGSQPAPR